jgi:hypothetical protein
MSNSENLVGSIPPATINFMYTIKLGGGDKATQQSDIEISKKLALQLLMPQEAQE